MATVQRTVQQFAAGDAVEATFGRARVPTYDGGGNVTGHTIGSTMQIVFAVRDGASDEVETHTFDVGPVPNAILAAAWQEFTPAQRSAILDAAWADFKLAQKLTEG